MNKKTQKPKLCFVSLNSYHILIEKNSKYAGGAEVQQVELAKGLKNKGYGISFVTYGGEKLNPKNVDEMQIIPSYKLSDVAKISFVKKLRLIYKALKKSDADVYIYQAGNPGIVSLYCFFKRKKMIKLLASDADVTGEAIMNEGGISRILGRLGTNFDIKHSDVVIAQNNFQKTKLKEKYKVESYLIKNAFDLSTLKDFKKKGEFVLWVGMIRSIKQPYLFLEIAKSLPDYKFVMVGGVAESKEFFEKIKKDAAKIPNLEFKGFVPRAKIFDYYKKASTLVNTSKTEGFPNIFIEAWMHKTPVVSLNINPDEIITENKIGFHSKNMGQIKKDIANIMQDKKLRETFGDNAFYYVKKNHDINKIVNLYQNIISYLLK